MGDDVRVEDGGEERQGDVARHDGHELTGEPHLPGGETPGEEGVDVRCEREAQPQRHGADHDVEHEVHAIKGADVLLCARDPFLRVEADVRLREAEREEREREDERVRRLVHAVIRLPHERQEHRRVDEVDEVLDDDVGVAEQRAGLALTSHGQHH